jgi:hypothetical protein
MSPGGETSKMPLDPDDDLLQEVRKAPEGDLRAFEQLVVRHQRRLIANCRYLTGDPNNAEDLTQDVLVKAFFGLPKFNRKSSFGPLAYANEDRPLSTSPERAGGSNVRPNRRS